MSAGTSQGTTCYIFNRGSRAARSPSPRKLKLITVRVIITPGRMASQGTVSKYPWALVSMLPQLASGGWSAMHYPLSEQIPEMACNYKPLKGIVWVPTTQIEGSQTIFLSGEEITGEFLGEMKSIERGVAAWLENGAGGQGTGAR